MQNVAPSLKNFEEDQEQDASAHFIRSAKRRNALILTPSSPEFYELQKKIHEPVTQASIGSIG